MLFSRSRSRKSAGNAVLPGEFTVLWRLPVDAVVLLTTTHLAVGALMLAAAVTLTLGAHRLSAPPKLARRKDLDGATFR